MESVKLYSNTFHSTWQPLYPHLPLLPFLLLTHQPTYLLSPLIFLFFIYTPSSSAKGTNSSLGHSLVLQFSLRTTLKVKNPGKGFLPKPLGLPSSKEGGRKKRLCLPFAHSPKGGKEEEAAYLTNWPWTISFVSVRQRQSPHSPALQVQEGMFIKGWELTGLLL